jgi:hypothetical protein
MAANPCDVNFSSVALTGTTAKTVAGVKAATNVAVTVLENRFSADGATSSNAPAVVDLARCTFATNSPGTNSTSFTPLKREPGRAETVQATAGYTWTTEPTVITAQNTMDVGQFNGLYHYINPYNIPFVVAGAAGWVIRANSPNNVNCSGGITFLE